MNRRQFLKNSSLAVPFSLGIADFVSAAAWSTSEFHIEQFKDTGLAHFSYAIAAGQNIVLIDPGRNPEQYYQFAEKKGLPITAVIETHPHADFVSSHLEIHESKKATVHASKLVNAQYPHKSFDEGDVIRLSANVTLKALNTPGHSPDSISILLVENGRNVAVFSGDALLFGDVGRPDLRDYSGDYKAQKKVLASQMYYTVKDKFAKLEDHVKLYPAHGAGSLCGKAIRDVNESTIGYERENNHAFQIVTEDAFVSVLLADQPNIPFYFPFDVETNKKGISGYKTSLAKVPKKSVSADGKSLMTVDTRPAEEFRKSHRKGAINIPDGGKFETWLGSIIRPESKFDLVASTDGALDMAIDKMSKIGYEKLVTSAAVYHETSPVASDELKTREFTANPEGYTVIDLRMAKEVAAQPYFKNAVNIPVTELSDRLAELPVDKPILVHCASGYRSAIGASIIKAKYPNLTVYDLGPEITSFKK